MELGASIHSKRTNCKWPFAAVAVCCAVAACSPPEYSSPAWSGRVIERDSGAPIEGAIVVVRWQLEGFDAKFAGWLLMDEAVSDKDGIFRFKSWGPMRTPDSRGSRTRMSPNVPEISVFKSGYEVEASGGGSDSGYLDDRFYTGPSERRVFADDHVIAMDRYRGTLKEYREYLERTFPIQGGPCTFEKTPRLFAAAIIVDRSLNDGMPSDSSILSMNMLDYYYSKGHSCGKSLSDAVKEYLP